MDQVDAAIIGFGAASKPLALDLADAGLTVAVIERSTRMYGGACVNTACLPSKMLVHAAAMSAFEGGEFPARAERYEAVIDEKNEATARLRERSYRMLADNPRIEVIDGEASFVDATHLSVRTADDERQLEAARTFIDTGSVPALPDIPGADGKRVYTSESLLDVKILPERTVIVGAGYVGLEFASLFGDFALVATGRRPATDGLNLEAAGVQVDVRGAIVTDEHLRTTVPNIWAMGDVTEPQQFTYVSYDDYRIVASDVLGDGTKTKGTRGAVPSCIFADPPLAHVGLTEQEARDQGFDVACAVMTADDMPKVPLLGKEARLMKGVVDNATGRVLGIHLYCTGAPEIVNLAKRFLDDGCTAADIRDAVFTHPTVTEELNNLFAKVAG